MECQRGRPRELDMRQEVNAIFYIVRSGVQWRMLPGWLIKKAFKAYLAAEWSNALLVGQGGIVV